jgi:hypothetical protein
MNLAGGVVAAGAGRATAGTVRVDVGAVIASSVEVVAALRVGVGTTRGGVQRR